MRFKVPRAKDVLERGGGVVVADGVGGSLGAGAGAGAVMLVSGVEAAVGW